MQFKVEIASAGSTPYIVQWFVTINLYICTYTILVYLYFFVHYICVPILNYEKMKKTHPKCYRFQVHHTWLIAWSFTTSPNHKVTIWWGFFRLSATMWASKAAGPVCLKKPHNIVTPQAGEAINHKSSRPVVTIDGTEKLC